MCFAIKDFIVEQLVDIIVGSELYLRYKLFQYIWNFIGKERSKRERKLGAVFRLNLRLTDPLLRPLCSLIFPHNCINYF